MNTKLVNARRAVERLHLEARGASEIELRIWEAGHLVADLETAENESAAITARRTALLMDLVLVVVAALTMAFSLGNIHTFAAGHAVKDPIAWFLAPAVDLALCAALLGDAVLSRWELDAGPWATRLRWFAGGATLALNTWQPWSSLDPASIVLHSVPPVLLFLLAEAASPYRMGFAETVRRAAARVVRPEQEPERTTGPTAAQEAVQEPVENAAPYDPEDGRDPHSYDSIYAQVEADHRAVYEETDAASERTYEEIAASMAAELRALDGAEAGKNAQVSARTPVVAARVERSRPTVVRAARTAAAQTAREAVENAEELERQRQQARETYARSLADGSPIGASALGRLYGKSEGWGRKQIEAVKADSEVEAGADGAAVAS
ncbi:hypothetical protein [Kitasatospora acidiphila]|uniref:hypothetical protein n=1 Tax=Kitasatospora acidiphila TaxID=2567942 RepID=UPI003C7764E7